MTRDRLINIAVGIVRGLDKHGISPRDQERILADALFIAEQRNLHALFIAEQRDLAEHEPKEEPE